uniref:Putative disease resistance protein At5g63020 n=1 Tax=Anthurium amnicola TaxID=1678845 RepID=A0A1D1YHR9_9ARAE
MCLWLTGGEYDKKNTFLVYAGRKDSNHIPISEKWGDAKRVSLMYSTLESHWVLSVPSCSNLQTLLCPSARLSHIPQGFLKLMPILRVLDLSSTGLIILPDEIGLLGELRYLNLRGTPITYLPKGLANLANLRLLDLDDTKDLSHIPLEVIPTLTGLQALGLYGSRYDFVWPIKLSRSLLDVSSRMQKEGTSTSSSPATQLSMRSGRGSWDKLEELRLWVRTSSSLETLWNSDKLCRCTIALKIDARAKSGITSAHLSIDFVRLEKLRSLVLLGEFLVAKAEFSGGSKSGSSLEVLHLDSVHEVTIAVTRPPGPPLFGRLRTLWVEYCTGIRDLMWVRQLPCLQEIHVHKCWGMEEILPMVDGLEGVNEAPDCDCSSLLELRELHLMDLPILKSISRLPMLLPSLEVLKVCQCPQLKKLPLGPRSAKKFQRIHCEPEFWEGLDWNVDGQSVRSLFLPFYKSVPRDPEGFAWYQAPYLFRKAGLGLL